MPKITQIETKCNLEDTCWSRVKEMMACVEWNQMVMNILSPEMNMFYTFENE